jgi:hypothetical protein
VNRINLMSRPTLPLGTSTRSGLPTGGMCCGVGQPPVVAGVGGPAAWAAVYQFAYAAAAAQVAAEDRRRRLLGHVQPSVN